MKDLPLKKLRNFGGKLGAELGEMNCTTAGEVAALPHKALVAKFGEERATFIARAVRGYSDEPVQARSHSVYSRTVCSRTDLCGLSCRCRAMLLLSFMLARYRCCRVKHVHGLNHRRI